MINDLNILFDQLNTQYFEGKLSRPLIVFIDMLRPHNPVMGKYDSINHVIYIETVLQHLEYHLKKTLYHEMCHIVVQNHGPAFQALEARYDG